MRGNNRGGGRGGSRDRGNKKIQEDEDENDDENENEIEEVDQSEDMDEEDSSENIPEEEEVEEDEQYSLSEASLEKLTILFERFSEEPSKSIKNKNGKKGKNTVLRSQPELELLSSKGFHMSDVINAVDHMTTAWPINSVDSRIDYLIAVSHMLIHFEEKGACVSILSEVLEIYEESGLLRSIRARTNKFVHPWSKDLGSDSDVNTPLSRTMAGKTVSGFPECSCCQFFILFFCFYFLFYV